MRGDVSSEVSFSYSTERGQDYNDLLGSVKKVDDDDIKAHKLEGDKARKLQKDMPVIEAIREVLKDGQGVSQAELTKLVRDIVITGRDNIFRVANFYSNTKDGGWEKVKSGIRNEYFYRIASDGSDDFESCEAA
jgi:hypothetical protein